MPNGDGEKKFNCMPGIVIGSRDTTMNKKLSSSNRLPNSLEEQHNVYV